MPLSSRHFLIVPTWVAAFLLIQACGGRTDLDELPGAGSVNRGADAGAAGKGGNLGGRGGNSGSGGNSGGRGGNSGGSGGSATGPCAEVPCYADLINDCLPEGECTMQAQSGASSNTTTANVCFANGVKEQVVARLTGSGVLKGTVTYKRGNAICFSMDVAFSSDGKSASYVVRDGAGKQVATASEDARGTTMTCTGGQPTRLSPACVNAGASDSECTRGLCSF
jgi:hypothetical protein